MKFLFGIVAFLLFATPVLAYDVRLRAVHPNPPGSDEGEWIALENVTSASIAAQLYSVRDVYGSVKTFALGSFLPLEIKMVTASQSGITLNNAEEMVELLHLSQVVESSPKMVASQEGKIWTQLATGWQILSENEFLEKKDKRDWDAISAEESIGQGVPFLENASVVQLKEKVIQRGVGPGEDATEIPRVLPQLKKMVIKGATISGVPQWPLPPEPDYDAEMAVFLDWKREALIGSLAQVFGGICLLLTVLPPIPSIWRWLRDELLL